MFRSDFAKLDLTLSAKGFQQNDQPQKGKTTLHGWPHGWDGSSGGSMLIIISIIVIIITTTTTRTVILTAMIITLAYCDLSWIVTLAGPMDGMVGSSGGGSTLSIISTITIIISSSPQQPPPPSPPRPFQVATMGKGSGWSHGWDDRGVVAAAVRCRHHHLITTTTTTTILTAQSPKSWPFQLTPIYYDVQVVLSNMSGR